MKRREGTDSEKGRPAIHAASSALMPVTHANFFCVHDVQQV